MGVAPPPAPASARARGRAAERHAAGAGARRGPARHALDEPLWNGTPAPRRGGRGECSLELFFLGSFAHLGAVRSSARGPLHFSPGADARQRVQVLGRRVRGRRAVRTVHDARDNMRRALRALAAAGRLPPPLEQSAEAVLEVLPRVHQKWPMSTSSSPARPSA